MARYGLVRKADRTHYVVEIPQEDGQDEKEALKSFRRSLVRETLVCSHSKKEKVESLKAAMDAALSR